MRHLPTGTGLRILAGSMIHDLYGLRVMFGVPEAVVQYRDLE